MLLLQLLPPDRGTIQAVKKGYLQMEFWNLKVENHR